MASDEQVSRSTAPSPSPSLPKPSSWWEVPENPFEGLDDDLTRNPSPEGASVLPTTPPKNPTPQDPLHLTPTSWIQRITYFSGNGLIGCLQEMNKDAELNLDPDVIAASSSLLESHQPHHLVAFMLWLSKGSPPGTRYSSILDTDDADSRWVLLCDPVAQNTPFDETWALLIEILKEAR